MLILGRKAILLEGMKGTVNATVPYFFAVCPGGEGAV